MELKPWSNTRHETAQFEIPHPKNLMSTTLPFNLSRIQRLSLFEKGGRVVLINDNTTGKTSCSNHSPSHLITVHTPSRFRQSKVMWVGGRKMYWNDPKTETYMFKCVYRSSSTACSNQTHIHGTIKHSNLASRKFLILTFTIVTKENVDQKTVP